MRHVLLDVDQSGVGWQNSSDRCESLDKLIKCYPRTYVLGIARHAQFCEDDEVEQVGDASSDSDDTDDDDGRESQSENDDATSASVNERWLAVRTAASETGYLLANASRLPNGELVHDLIQPDNEM